MNKNLFGGTPGKLVPATNTVNEAGGKAYLRSSRDALAQFAVTGRFNDTFYVRAEDQLKDVLEQAAQCDPLFVAKTAVYSRRAGRMKDMPAFLLATLATRDAKLMERAFPLVIDNGKMLRNFVQAIRSGSTGRKSFAGKGVLRRCVQQWFDARSDADLFHANIGDKPSLADVIRLTHVRPPGDSGFAALVDHRDMLATRKTIVPGTKREPMAWKRRNDTARSHMLAYLVGRPYDFAKLPPIAQQFELFKLDATTEVPNCNFQFLSALPNLTEKQWTEIARRCSWQTLRMNLNTFARHGVFQDESMLRAICARLIDVAEIQRSGVLPYQLMSAYLHVDEALPPGIKMSLAQAMEQATLNVPKFAGQLAIGVDVSGSMTSASITGSRKGSTSKMRCVDVASLIACSLLRANPTALVLPFDTSLHIVGAKGTAGASFARGSVAGSAEALSKFGGGGTDCSLPLRWLHQEKRKIDLVVIVSDNESWFDATSGRGTATMQAWRLLKLHNPTAKLVCIDLTPHKTTQAVNEKDVANVGGFSDEVFEFLAAFASGDGQWAERIEATQLP